MTVVPDPSKGRRLNALERKLIALERRLAKMDQFYKRYTTPLFGRLWQYSLNHEFGYTAADKAPADLLTIQGVDTSRDVTVTDSLGTKGSMQVGDTGLCIEQIDIDGTALYVALDAGNTHVLLGKTRGVNGVYPSSPANVLPVRLLQASFTEAAGEQTISLTTIEDLIYAFSPCCYIQEDRYVMAVRQRNGKYFIWPCSCGSTSTSSSASASASGSGSTSGSASGSVSGSSGSVSGSGSTSGGSCDACTVGASPSTMDLVISGVTTIGLCACQDYNGTFTIDGDPIYGCVYEQSWDNLNSDPCYGTSNARIELTYDSGTNQTTIDFKTYDGTTTYCEFSATVSGKVDCNNLSQSLSLVTDNGGQCNWSTASVTVQST